MNVAYENLVIRGMADELLKEATALTMLEDLGQSPSGPGTSAVRQQVGQLAQQRQIPVARWAQFRQKMMNLVQSSPPGSPARERAMAALGPAVSGWMAAPGNVAQAASGAMPAVAAPAAKKGLSGLAKAGITGAAVAGLLGGGALLGRHLGKKKEAMGAPASQEPGKMQQYMPWYGAAGLGAVGHHFGGKLAPPKYKLLGQVGGTLLGTALGVHGGEALGKKLDRPKTAGVKSRFLRNAREEAPVLLTGLGAGAVLGGSLERLRQKKSKEKQARVLTMKGRNQIKEKNFALPGGRYPIHDASHAKNALTRVRQFGTPEEKAKVYAAVAKKHPGLAARSSLESVREKVKTKRAEAEEMPPHPALTAARSIGGLGVGALAGYGGMKAIDALMRARGGKGLPQSAAMSAIPVLTGLGGMAYTRLQDKTLKKMRDDHLKRQQIRAKKDDEGEPEQTDTLPEGVGEDSEDAGRWSNR